MASRALNGTQSQNYGVSLAIWDHSVTCHLTQVNTPHLNPSGQPDRPVLELTTVQGWKSELTLVTGYILKWIPSLSCNQQHQST